MLRVITAPASDARVMSLADLKARLRVDFSDDDAVLDMILLAATEMAERFTSRRFLTQTLEWVTDNLVPGMRLPVAPVASVTFVKALDYPAGPAYTTLAASDYIVSPDGKATIINKPYNLRWPWVGQGAEPVVIRFVAGGAASAVSPSTLTAIAMLAGHFYNNREAFRPGSAPLQEVPWGVQALLSGDQW